MSRARQDGRLLLILGFVAFVIFGCTLERIMGASLVDFRAVFTKLHRVGYKGAISIERETSGPQQIEDVKAEKAYLERVIREVNA